ncbi:Cytidine deaminase [uncultured Alphaproteobacteria bacterium]|uniref:Cytidine deaminase n=1 Tax=uncultured Alphaproteobacteria bacterium TaxID=91750 RepID=A0A212JB11_9PROT|nr:Cytidine deaminase [uncultured Alphaproteobacteria bacterium]
MDDLAELVARARAVRAHAYAPYSHYPVGAAIRADDGTVYVGCNVENAAYPEGLCAEAVALGAMVAAGRRRLVAVAVAGGDARAPATPCGGCRQKLTEFAAPGAVVAVADGDDGPVRRLRLDDLLPGAFDGRGKE